MQMRRFPKFERLLSGEFHPGVAIVVGAPHRGEDGEEELTITRKPEQRVAAVS